MNTGFLSGVVFNVFADELIKILTSVVFIVLLVIALGYLLGRVNIKGVSFGSSGVFIVALVVGILLYLFGDKMIFTKVVGMTPEGKEITETIGFTWVKNLKVDKALFTVKEIGLALFVTGIGFVAGPTFIRNFKKKAVSYITIGATVVVIGTALCLLFIAIDSKLDPATAVGLLMGALTSTPGLSSAQGVFGNSGTIAAASGLAYPFGVLGVVLFVQLMPKILRKDMKTEVEKLKLGVDSNVKVVDEAIVTTNPDMVAPPPKKRITLDSLGLCAFGLAAALGMILGALAIPMGKAGKFSLGTTGGALIMGILFGHFGHAGPLSLEVPKTTINPLKELGLIFFLAASGIEGGLKFLETFRTLNLLYGVIMTLVPMIVVFFIARYAFKLELLNNLGSITGGMTSTPALGALVHVSKTDDVAQSYAATYPIALFLLVLVPQLIYLIFPA